MKRSRYVSLAVCFVAVLGASAQVDRVHLAAVNTDPEPDSAKTWVPDSLRSTEQERSRPTYSGLRASVLGLNTASSPGPPSLAPAHRAFFCRFDDQLDAARVPLRFRLGSLDYVNALERKPGW